MSSARGKTNQYIISNLAVTSLSLPKKENRNTVANETERNRLESMGVQYTCINSIRSIGHIDAVM